MGYECVMCMETLESGAPPQISNNEDGTSRTKAKKRGRTEDLSEICATPCGHMFHKACLIRWFEETEKKGVPFMSETRCLVEIGPNVSSSSY